MKWVILVLMLLAFVTGGLAAAGDLGSKCDTGDTCSDSHAYCDTTNALNKKCKCNTRWFQKGSVCVRGAGQLCDVSQCYTGLLCTGGACMCDTTTVGYTVGTNGTVSCTCDSGKTDTYGKCEKLLGQTGCTQSTNCVSTTGVECNGGTCGCQASLHRVANSGNTACVCDTSKSVDESGTCKLKLGESGCSSASDCVTTTGSECSGGTCGCQASLFLAANSANTMCVCDTSKAVDESGTCKLKIGQSTCSSASNCVPTPGGQCTGGTCACDSTAHFTAKGDNSGCECTTNYALKVDGATCGLVIGQTCTAVGDCIDYTTCAGGPPTTCACDTSANRAAGSAADKSCSCDTNYHDDGGVCKLKLTQANCTSASDCVSGTGVECNSGTCDCQASLHRIANSGNTACDCDTNYVEESGTCKLKLEQSTCSSAGDCVTTPGVECSSGSCGCSSSSHRTPNSLNTQCVCDTSKAVDESGACKLKAGQACSTTSVCVTTSGMVCADDGGTNKCKCNNTAKYAVATNGHTTCSCASDYTSENNECVLRVGKVCGDSTPACVFGSVCDKSTSTCLCDTANNYQAGSVGDTSCACASGASSITINGKIYCGSKIGGPCTLKTDSSVCRGGTSCSETQFGSSDVHACVCNSGTAQDDGNCSGAEGQAATMLVLTVGLLTVPFL